MTRALAVSFSAAAVAVLAAAPAHGRVTVSGKLEAGKGFRVVALGTSGTGAVARAGSGGRFRLRLPDRLARGASLHLIGRDGSYRGPVVLRRERRTGFLRLAGRGVALGVVKRARGAARPRRYLPRRLVARRTTPLTARGVPRGAGRLGLVGRRGARPAQDGPDPGADADRDGVPGSFDVDDDGDEVLDTSEPGGDDAATEITSSLPLGLEDSLNVNATGVTRALVDERLRSDLNLLFFFRGGGVVEGAFNAVDVDCGGLRYCRPGSGTAVVRDASANAERGPWVEFDPNDDGLPNLERDGPVFVINVWPRVPTADIAPGDTFAFLARGEATTTVPASLVTYFTTTPAVRTYDSGAGPTTVTYPVEQGTPGTGGRPIQLASERLTVSFWRPQRLAIDGAEDGTFTDIGHLNYGARIDVEGVCRPEDYSNLSPTLSPAPQSFLDKSPEVVLRDSADDRAPDASSLLSFTVDIGACMRRQGIEPSGKNLVFSLTAEDDARNIARQHLTVRVP